jgi:hypothetical protein
MPGWLIFIFVALLLLIGIVAWLLILPDTEAAEGGGERAGRASVPAAQPPPVATLPPSIVTSPVNRPPAIVLRPLPANEPRLIIGGRTTTKSPPVEFRPAPPTDNGSKIKVGQVKVNLNVICRRTGRSMRVCSCGRCRKERTQFGL